MTEESTKKRDELAEDFIKKNLNIVWWQPTLIMKVAHQAGFDAGYQVAMGEANVRIQKLREALGFYEKISIGEGYGNLQFPARAALKEDDENLVKIHAKKYLTY